MDMDIGLNSNTFKTETLPDYDATMKQIPLPLGWAPQEFFIFYFIYFNKKILKKLDIFGWQRDVMCGQSTSRRAHKARKRPCPIKALL